MATFVPVCGLVAAIAAPLLQCGQLVLSPIFATTTNFINLQPNLHALERKIQDLANRIDEVTDQLEESERNGRATTTQAREWLARAEEAMEVAEEIMIVAGRRDLPAQGTGCFFACGLSRRVSFALDEVHKLLPLQFQFSPTQLELTNQRPPMVEHIPSVSVQDQPTGSQNLAKLMELLNCDLIRSIGVWGMGGVGKTTLLKNLNNKLHSTSASQPFGKVIWITVSREMNHKLLQTKIAERLGFDLRDGDEASMSAQLHNRLSKEKKFLLILDDVWEPIDLDNLGIPQLIAHAGYKILLTTRSQAVCSRMDMDEHFKVAILNDQEAWLLFSSIVGEVASYEEIVPYAKAVARECHGLPLAIKVVGAAMRRKEKVELWRDTLNELRRSRPSVPGIEKEVFNPLKLSYDFLQDESIKSCFLFCCLYPEDCKIDTRELVRCWVGEGLVGVGLSYEDSLNRGIAVLETLKDTCLLEHGKKEWLVTMHDLVRDVGIWIATSSKDGSKSLVLSGARSTQIAEAIEFNRPLKRVSLINNNMIEPPDDNIMVQCPETRALFLHGNELSGETLEGFMQGFRAIRVLNLTDTKIGLLPHSCMKLADLRILLLNGCSNLKELPTSGWEGLKRIQVLDLSKTSIRELPRGMHKLIKLRELHLVSTKALVNIPTGVFSVMSSLEVLNMEGSNYAWGLKVEVGDEKAHLEELENLNKLRALCIGLKSGTSLSANINLTWISRLTSFGVIVGQKTTLGSFSGVGREVRVQNIKAAEDERIGYLLSSTDATSLQIQMCGRLDRLVHNLALSNIGNSPFYALKSLSICNCGFSSRGGYDAQYDLLPNLEDVSVIGVIGVESISQLLGPLGLRLSKLMSLSVERCVGMRHLLSLGGPILNIEKLATVSVADCYDMEELFQYDSNGVCGSINDLRRIEMCKMPKLRTVCKETGEWPLVEEVLVSECPELKKLPLCNQGQFVEPKIKLKITGNCIDKEVSRVLSSPFTILLLGNRNDRIHQRQIRTHSSLDIYPSLTLHQHEQ